jgi:MarR family transcriptional regulator, lower aerobic nicotinate degradation pathway regulator
MVVKQLATIPLELVESPAFLLKRLGHAAKEESTAAFEDAGANAFHYAVLAVLAEGVRETQATIADALGYDPSYLVGVLDELEARGFVERRRDPADRRRQLVTMTPAGEKELERLRGVQAGLDDRLFSALSASELKTLRALLVKVAAARDPRCAP